jgi:TnpA family transposase
MPVEFLSDEVVAGYGRFAGVPSLRDLDRCCWLNDVDLALIRDRRRDVNRLGFAVQLATVRLVGVFVPDMLEVPWPVVESVAQQLGIADPGIVKGYQSRTKTVYEHQWKIVEAYNYRPWDTDTLTEVRVFIAARAWTSVEGPTRLFERAVGWLRDHKVLLPGITVLARLVSEVRAEQAERFHTTLAETVPASVRQRLSALLEVPADGRVSGLERLRSGPRVVAPAEVAVQVERLAELYGFGLASADFSVFPAGRMRSLARHGLTVDAAALRDLSPARTMATVIATILAITARTADDVGDIIDAVVSDRVVRRARRDAVAIQMASFRQLSQAALEMTDTVEAIINTLNDPTLADHDLRAALTAGLNLSAVRAAVVTVRASAHPDGDSDGVAAEMLRRYLTVRRLILAISDNSMWGSTTGGAQILLALNALPTLLQTAVVRPADIDPTVLSVTWLRRAVHGSTVDMRSYAVGVTEAVHRAMRGRDLYLEGGVRWGDPHTRLLSNTAWGTVKSDVLTGLNLPEQPGEHLTELAEHLDGAYQTVIEGLPENTAVRIDEAGKIHVSPHEPLGIPTSLKALRATTARMLPRLDLPELLLEVNAWTGFLDEFTHVSESSARMQHLDVSVAAVLVAQACNVGLVPVENENHEALTRKRLSHIEQSYLRADTLRAANSRLVDAQHNIGLADYWGGGLCASADGMRFVAPRPSVATAANPRYFGKKRGLTWFNILNDQRVGIGSVVIPGTMRDSLYILDGILEIDSRHRPDMIATDTASYSDQVFGLFALLGYRFSPRLADLPDQRFWAINRPDTYGPLATAARGRINLDLITENWDDMLRAAGALITGHTRASDLLRVTQSGGTPSILGRAIAEYGRIAKTLHLLDFIDQDDGYRREVHHLLAMQESRHALARRIFHGHSGEILEPYRTGQEEQLGALGLVMNAIILWNTRYLDHALATLTANGELIGLPR